MNATEITRFFLNHRGRCFEGWSAEKMLNYVLVNLVNKSVFAARDRSGSIALAAITSLGDAADIRHKSDLDLPQFTWDGFPTTGDSILIADVAGDRSLMPEILKQANAAWPGVLDKRLFTYRRGKLVELSWPTVERFCRIKSPNRQVKRRPRKGSVPQTGRLEREIQLTKPSIAFST